MAGELQLFCSAGCLRGCYYSLFVECLSANPLDEWYLRLESFSLETRGFLGARCRGGLFPAVAPSHGGNRGPAGGTPSDSATEKLKTPRNRE